MTRRVYTPHEYQKLIVRHIVENPRCAVWASMGMGKTSSTLTALDILAQVEDVYPALVLAPLRVAKSTWPGEAAAWEHLRGSSIIPVTGSEAERRISLRYDAPIYSCNYDNLVWLVEHYGDRWPFRTVVSDEATRLKSFRTRQGGVRAQALARVAHTKVKRFIELTGTPAPNGLKDTWGQMWFLDAGQRLGRSFAAFESRWFAYQRVQDAVNPGRVDVQTVILPGAQEQIHDLVRDLCLTVDAKDWFDLEEPIVRNVYVDLPTRARVHYREMEKELFTRIEGHGVEAFNAASRSLKCLQIASGAMYVDPLADSDDHPRAKEWKEVHDAKLQALDSIVEEANGAPVLVAYHFRSDLARIRRAFPRAEVLDDDPNTEARWNAGRIPILLAHPASAGHGLNLQHGGNTVVYFSHWWDLEQRMQILERIGPVRQKQSSYERPVWVYNIIARDTMDEQVIARTESKRSVQDTLLEAMKRRNK